MPEKFRSNYDLPFSKREMSKTPEEIKTEEIIEKLKAKKQLSETEKTELEMHEHFLEDMRKIRTGEDEERVQEEFKRTMDKLDEQIDRL